MSDFKINSIATKQGQHGPVIAGVSTVNSTGCMKIPSGPTEFRGGRGRGVVGGGRDASNPAVDTMDLIEIATAGNATDFGNLSDGGRDYPAGCGSATRGIFFGGSEPGFRNIIDFVIMSSSGGANDFGDMLVSPLAGSSLSNTTRGIHAGGLLAPTPSYTKSNLIDFITMASTGDATDFGSLMQPTNDLGSCSSPTRGFVFADGDTSDLIQFFTIQTLGDSTKFGELTGDNVRYPAGLSSNTRGIRAGGSTPSGLSVVVDVIDFWTMASEGNATDFGNLTVARNLLASCSSKVRGVFAGGYDSPVTYNTMDFITIASTGNASDFGDLTYSDPIAHTNGAARGFSGCSDVNGGLGD